MKIGCLSFLGISEVCYIKREKPFRTYSGNPEFFEIEYMTEIEVGKVGNEFKTIEEARERLRLKSIKCIEKQINRYMKILEEYGCENTQVNYRDRINSWAADTPSESKIGVASFVDVAISGEKTGNIKIFGLRT